MPPRSQSQQPVLGGSANSGGSPEPSGGTGGGGGGGSNGGAGAPGGSAKQRLRWTPELHERFVDAVTQLGGADRKFVLVRP